MVRRFPIQPTYRKENGIWHLDIDALVLPKGFTAQMRALVGIPAGAIGGNHRHPRAEAFIGLSEDLYIVWRDEAGTHEEPMMTQDVLYLYLVEPMTPHAVINRGTGQTVLWELADGPQHDVEFQLIVEG